MADKHGERNVRDPVPQVPADAAAFDLQPEDIVACAGENADFDHALFVSRASSPSRVAFATSTGPG